MNRTEIALFKPEIPPNTGNIGRLTFCTHSRFHIIDKPSFSLDESAVKRAGLDYWNQVDLHLHQDWTGFRQYVKSRSLEKGKPQNILAFSRFARRSYTDYEYTGNEILLFGSETTGLPDDIIEELNRDYPDCALRIPVFEECRSLNLANSVAIVLFESLRQRGFPGLNTVFENK